MNSIYIKATYLVGIGNHYTNLNRFGNVYAPKSVFWDLDMMMLSFFKDWLMVPNRQTHAHLIIQRSDKHFDYF